MCSEVEGNRDSVSWDVFSPPDSQVARMTKQATGFFGPVVVVYGQGHLPTAPPECFRLVADGADTILGREHLVVIGSSNAVPSL